jgi:hypothetical protein
LRLEGQASAVSEIGPKLVEACQGAGFIGCHQPRIPNDIGGQNRGEAAFHDNLPALGELSRYAQVSSVSYGITMAIPLASEMRPSAEQS